MRIPPVNLLLVLLVSLFLLGGCKESFVYQRSIAELNQKAQGMIAAGDYKGAIARLESALDLYPDEPTTMHNLAIAYQVDAQHEKALALFEKLLETEGMDKPTLYKSIGITHEAMGDQVMVRVDELTSGLPPARDPARPLPEALAKEKNPQRLTAEAIGHYHLAMENYQAALDNGLKEPQEVKNQLAALQDRVQKLQQSETQPGAR